MDMESEWKKVEQRWSFCGCVWRATMIAWVTVYFLTGGCWFSLHLSASEHFEDAMLGKHVYFSCASICVFCFCFVYVYIHHNLWLCDAGSKKCAKMHETSWQVLVKKCLHICMWKFFSEWGFDWQQPLPIFFESLNYLFCWMSQ